MVARCTSVVLALAVLSGCEALWLKADLLEDYDEDGLNAEEDCNDFDSGIRKDAVEICDGIDNDCDGMIDEGCAEG